MVKIEEHLSTPQTFAAFLEECSKDSRKFDDIFARMFCRFMVENKDVQAALNASIEKVDRNFFYRNLKRVWFPMYSGAIIVLTLIGKQLVEWALSFLPHK